MTKQSGLGANLFLGPYDLSGDVGAVDNISGPRGTQIITGIDKAAEERILTLRDGAMGFTGFWNAAASQIVLVLDDMPLTDVLATVTIPATFGTYVVGDACVSLNGKQITFDQVRGQDGSLGVSTQIKSNGYSIEWGKLLTTGKQTIGTGTVNGTSTDYGDTSTLFGAAAYLHVMSIASGTMGVKLQDSANNTDFDDLAGMAFTSVTAATSERIQGAATATVRRYVRLVTTGVHGAAVMVVTFARYLTNPAI